MGAERVTFDRAQFAEELAAAHENFVVGTRLLLENERVRVWDLTLAPRERVPFHRHRTSYFYRCHAGGPTLVRSPQGEAFLYESIADEVTFHPIEPGEVVVHDLENAGETTLAFTTVELLGLP
jgi:beta-alanine degradation protein BauB